MYNSTLLLFDWVLADTPYNTSRTLTHRSNGAPAQPPGEPRLLVRIILPLRLLRITLIIRFLLIIIPKRQKSIVDPHRPLNALLTQQLDLGRVVVELLEVAEGRLEAAEKTTLFSLGAYVLRCAKEGSVGVLEEAGG